MRPRILIADDNECLRDLMAAILEACGYSVTLTSDGHAAWEELANSPPHLALLDIEMPIVDGCEVCRRIKSQPETRDIPVILVSARDDTDELARKAGADCFLNKPFSIYDLRLRVESLINPVFAKEETL